MFYRIYDIPTYQLAIVMAALFVGFSWIGLLLIRPLMRLFVLRGAAMPTMWSATSFPASAFSTVSCWV